MPNQSEEAGNRWHLENFAEPEREVDMTAAAKITLFLNKHELQPGQFVIVPGQGIVSVIYFHSARLQK